MAKGNIASLGIDVLPCVDMTTEYKLMVGPQLLSNQNIGLTDHVIITEKPDICGLFFRSDVLPCLTSYNLKTAHNIENSTE